MLVGYQVKLIAPDSVMHKAKAGKNVTINSLRCFQFPAGIVKTYQYNHNVTIVFESS
jgi:hypothetical protein